MMMQTLYDNCELTVFIVFNYDKRAPYRDTQPLTCHFAADNVDIPSQNQDPLSQDGTCGTACTFFVIEV